MLIARQQTIVASENVVSRRTKVAEVRVPIVVDEDVLGLEVAVDDLRGARVQVVQCARDLQRQLDPQRPIDLDRLLQEPSEKISRIRFKKKEKSGKLTGWRRRRRTLCRRSLREPFE